MSALLPRLLAASEDADENGQVITVPLETWVSIGALIGVSLSLAGLILAAIRSLRTEIKSDIAQMRTVVDRLDDRVYTLATRQSTGPLIVPRSRD
ncbi:hypothetical protein [Aeromicrobium sp. Sec7.5]|uniref:hypothetical protein n=1 Tax=Aeromicrobium sp. Sec7.5 TaxID=3121276 RepID=UPI002FE49287